MKRIAAFLIVGFLMVVGLIACSDDPESPDGFEGLVGSWLWVETCYPMPIECDTPESLGYYIRLSFSADSIYQKYRNDTLQVECEYSVIRGDIGDGVTRTLLTFDCSDDTLVFVFEDELTLTLSLGMPGSSVERYTRSR